MHVQINLLLERSAVKGKEENGHLLQLKGQEHQPNLLIQSCCM